MYQFIHVESYSKVASKKKLEKSYNKETTGRNVAEIVAEATREPEYCDHVTKVRPSEPPILLYGVEPTELIELTDDYFENTKLTNNKGVTRGLRKDSHVLLAGIISLNREVEDIWNDYKKDAIDWLKAKYGDKLKCVIEHTDEANPHLHFYCVQDHGISFDLLHEGKKAFSEVGGKLKYKKEIAFKNAMREFQNDFYNDVSLKYGLMKTGPKRGRYTNEEYNARKEQIKSINEHKKKTEQEIKEKIIKSNNEIKKINSIIEDSKKEAFKFVIDDFNKKNVFNKLITSVSYNKEKANKYDYTAGKLKYSEKRRELYKNKFNVELKEKNKLKKENNYLNKINDFLTFDINEESNNGRKENVRRRIIEQVEFIETEQQQISDRLKKAYNIELRTRAKSNDFRSRIDRVRRSLLYNISSYVRDIFTCELFKRFTKQDIEKPKYEQIEKAKERERNREERTNIKKLEL